MIDEDKAANTVPRGFLARHQYAVRRVLWWAGLILQLPALAIWLDGGTTVLYLFAEFPTHATDIDDSASRTGLVLKIGLICWFVVLTLRAKFENPDELADNRQVFVILLTAATVFSTCVALFIAS